MDCSIVIEDSLISESRFVIRESLIRKLGLINIKIVICDSLIRESGFVNCGLVNPRLVKFLIRNRKGIHNLVVK